jgi:hypothetical protein
VRPGRAFHTLKPSRRHLRETHYVGGPSFFLTEKRKAEEIVELGEWGYMLHVKSLRPEVDSMSDNELPKPSVASDDDELPSPAVSSEDECHVLLIACKHGR